MASTTTQPHHIVMKIKSEAREKVEKQEGTAPTEAERLLQSPI